jgi:hypothetical protein
MCSTLLRLLGSQRAFTTAAPAAPVRIGHPAGHVAAEELGLDREPGALLCVDRVPPRPNRSEGLITVFDGGRLEPGEIERIRLQPDALASRAFVDIVEPQLGINAKSA